MLYLLAGIAGVDDYETPGDVLTGTLADLTPFRKRTDPELRRAQVMAAVMSAGGAM